MFKLKKIMNKSNNGCEIEFYPSSESVTVKYGEILSLYGGVLSSHMTTVDLGCPLYYVLGDAIADDTTTALPCVRINEDMIFEATAMSKLELGSPAKLFAESEYDGAMHVCEVDDGGLGDAEVIDNSTYAKKQTLYVRIRNK